VSVLHLGTFYGEVLLELLPRREVSVFRAGDSWEEWGDGPSHVYQGPLDAHAEPYRHHPEHIVVRDHGAGSSALLTDVAFILQEDPFILVPMTWPGQLGTIAAISSDDDWAEQYLTLIDEPARRWLQAHLAGIDSHLSRTEADRLRWQDPAWRTFQHLDALA
jgi:hypothetical protein